MTTAVANHPDDLGLRSYVFYSIAFHVVLTVCVLSASYLDRRGNSWGGIGGKLGGTKVSLVSAAGIPMPRETVVTDSKAVDPTKGLYKEEPPKPPEPKTDATKIPKFEKEKKLPPSPKSRTFESKTPIPDNAVPYGERGNPSLPTGYSPNPGGSPGVNAQGPGGGDFGARYPWYVDAVRSRIRQAWDQSTIEPAVRAARRAHAVVTFRINPNGNVSNIKLFQTSGNSSMDYSALRALQNIDAFRPLPNDYMGSYVEVTFDFDLSMAQ
jgi:periplasmic protein TonB